MRTYIYSIKELYRQRESLYKCYKSGQITLVQYLAFVKPLDFVIDKHEMSMFLGSHVSGKAFLLQGEKSER